MILPQEEIKVVRLPSESRDLKMLESRICRRKWFLISGQEHWFDSWTRRLVVKLQKVCSLFKSFTSKGAGITIYLHFLLPLEELICLNREGPGFVLSPTNLSSEISVLISDSLRKNSCFYIVWARWRHEKSSRER